MDSQSHLTGFILNFRALVMLKWKDYWAADVFFPIVCDIIDCVTVYTKSLQIWPDSMNVKLNVEYGNVK